MSVDNSIVIYKGANRKTELQINIKKDTIWLSLDQISTVFQKNKSTISRHIKNIFETNELERNQVVANYATTAKDDKVYQVDYYSLDMIISIGYTVTRKPNPSPSRKPSRLV